MIAVGAAPPGACVLSHRLEDGVQRLHELRRTCPIHEASDVAQRGPLSFAYALHEIDVHRIELDGASGEIKVNPSQQETHRLAPLRDGRRSCLRPDASRLWLFIRSPGVTPSVKRHGPLRDDGARLVRRRIGEAQGQGPDRCDPAVGRLREPLDRERACHSGGDIGLNGRRGCLGRRRSQSAGNRHDEPPRRSMLAFGLTLLLVVA